MTKPNNTLQDRLDADYPEAWKPAPGDSLIGEVIELAERDAGYGPYPLLTIRQDSGQTIAVHAFHGVLASQLAEQRPALNERIGIKYRGKVTGEGPHGPYHSYTVKVDRPAGASVDWSRYGDGQEQQPAATVDVGNPAPSPAPADPDDTPF